MHAILFDFDRTLWDTDEGIYHCHKRVAFELGIQKYHSYADYRKLLHLHWHEINECVGIPSSLWDTADQLFAQFLPEHIADAKPFSGIENIIPRLAEKYKLAIVTTSFQHAIDPLLQKYHLHDSFQAIIDWHTKPHKPSPYPVYEALCTLGIKNIHACIIGDSPTDIQAGKAAGLANVYGAAWNTLSRAALQDADALFSVPEELLTLTKL